MREGPRNTRSPPQANSLLGVSPEAAEEEVKDHEPTEEENGDYGHKPYSQQKVDCLQSVVNQPFVCLPLTGSSKDLAKSRDGRIRTGDHSAPSRVRYLTAPRPGMLPEIISDKPHAIIDSS
jgi:hypothetical protein